MIRYASIEPVVAMVSPNSQRDRLDTFYYHPFFRDLDQKIASQTDQITDIESISIFVTDGTHQTPIYVEKDNNGVLFLSATNIMEEGLSVENVKYIPRSLHESYSNCSPSVGDVMVAKNGKTGVACVFPNGLPECSIYVSIALIRLKSGWLPEFISLVINSEIGYLQIQRNQKGIGVKNLHLEDIRQIQIPEIGEFKQKEILIRYATIKECVRKIDEKSKAFFNHRLNVSRKFDEILSNSINGNSIYEIDEWDWHKSQDSLSKVTTKNEKCAVLSKIQERMDPRFNLPNRLRKLVDTNPSAWGVLADFVIIDRSTYASNGKLPHIAIDEMPNDPWSSFETEEAGYTGATILLESGDIVISRLMPTIMNGKCFIVWKKMTGSPEFIRISVKEELQQIVLFWLKSSLVREYLLASVRGSSASQKRFTEDDLEKCPIPKDIIKNPSRYLGQCQEALEDAMKFEKKSHELEKESASVLKKAKANIFDLLDEEFLNELKREAMEALQ
jgi:restriction endonuclease S subunit